MIDRGISESNELDWALGIIHSLEVGLIVLNQEGVVCLWNDFMENHSGISTQTIIGSNLFNVYPELATQWFHQKLESVFMLHNSAYIFWEQHPYLFKFKTTQPITGMAPYMYQNATMVPLKSLTGKVEYIGILVYDVTQIVMNQIELQNANLRLQDLSRVDRLTELYNRGYWEECLHAEFERFYRSQRISSLIIFDIDFFKKVNDTYGHQAGDEVIRQVAQALREHGRKTDIMGRYGGEEFVCILLDTEADNAVLFAERLRTNIERLQINYNEQEINFTVSLGVAEAEYQMENAMQWLEAADKALYQSKQQGRNRTTLHNE